MVTGEGAAEDEVVVAMRATVGEVGCGREGRKVRMRMQLRLWLRRKGDGGRQLGREAAVERMGSDCRFLPFFSLFLFVFDCCNKVAGKDKR
ncbi:hypothetical protein BHE74_00049456 [Ensete ventricosum]|uniref:Uncharacterized protein n=1 Tax=Ensete ventricosum TaxID=4639 RepID=A0A444EID2_ENSVE|nr:hypothetical protein GW17_00026338 [Ensete ventricosum]RWW44761.1 hypothetical protein BHE74_00049456 [Ensete ventricosum]RZR75173.1 hypothetical protein BHM03_00050974 [Ensete ventricosum]